MNIQEAPESKEEKEEEKSEAVSKAAGVLEPRTRAPGGIWMQASDFPFCFQHMLVFHNPKKFKNQLVIEDIWTKPEENTYICDELHSFVHIKATVQEEGSEKPKEETDPIMTPPGSAFGLRSDINQILQGPKENRDHSLLVAFMPYPVSKWHEVPPMPRYSLNPVTPAFPFGDPRDGGLAGPFHKYLEARLLKDISGEMD